jgi:predicted O-methyltransferase YrrM
VIALLSEILAAYPNIVIDECDHRFLTIGDRWPVEVEVCGLLYGIVRATKPAMILDLGTNIGLSASAFALGIRDNCINPYHNDPQHGLVVSIDIDDMNAQKYWNRIIGISQFILFKKISSLEFIPHDSFDIIFVDTLAELLHAELERYHSTLTKSGIFLIHDTRIDYPKRKHLMFKKREAIVTFLKDHLDFREYTFKTARGVTMLFRRA